MRRLARPTMLAHPHAKPPAIQQLPPPRRRRRQQHDHHDHRDDPERLGEHEQVKHRLLLLEGSSSPGPAATIITLPDLSNGILSRRQIWLASTSYGPGRDAIDHRTTGALA